MVDCKAGVNGGQVSTEVPPKTGWRALISAGRKYMSTSSVLNDDSIGSSHPGQPHRDPTLVTCTCEANGHIRMHPFGATITRRIAQLGG